MLNSYPSDITKEQFAKIKPILESARKKTRPRSLDLYDIFCGILYVLKSGCQWRMLPKEFPKWRTCHYYFSVWSEKESDKSKSILEKVLKKMLVEVRQSKGRKKKQAL
jgi:transposase